MEQTYTQRSEQSQVGNKPEKHIAAGSIRATVWKNEVTPKDGPVTSFRTVTFERTYKDKNGDWKTSSALRLNDLPKASLVLSKAYEYLAMNES
jgi:hypothetical protein